MNKIKFSHNYFKIDFFPLGTIFSAKLLHVFVEDSKNFQEDFVDYDTAFINQENGLRENYVLPKGKVLVLLFFNNYDRVFTTIRRWTIEKEDYYRSKIGERFQVVIE